MPGRFQEAGPGLWTEQAADLQGPATAHRAWRVVQWPEGAVEERLALLHLPTTDPQGLWPQLRWAYRIVSSPLGLSGALAVKLRRLEMALQQAHPELGPRREEWAAYEGLKALRDAIVFGGERLVQVDALLVLTTTPERLAAESQLLLGKLDSLDIAVSPVVDGQLPALWRAWGGGPPPRREGTSWRHRLAQIFRPAVSAAWSDAPDWEPRIVSTERAAGLVWPGWGQPTDTAQGIYIGHTEQGHPASIDFRQDVGGGAANVLVSGNTGLGKSFWLKALVQGFRDQGWQVIILDVDGEYRALCEAVGGAWLDVSGQRAGYYLDPTALPAPTGDPEEDQGRFRRMLDTTSTLLAILGGGLDEAEQGAIERAVTAAHAAHGVRLGDPATWRAGAACPLPEVWQRLRDAGQADPAAARAADRTWRAVFGSQASLFQGRPAAWDRPPRPLTVWHLGTLAQEQGDARLSPALAGRFHLVWQATWQWLRQLRRTGQWVLVVSDEGQRILPDPILGGSVVGLASTIRKWNGVLAFATNRPDPLWTEPAGQAIWSTTPVKVLLGMEQAQAEAASRALRMPATVTATLPDMAQASQAEPSRKGWAWVRNLEGHWFRVRAAVPPAEAALYATRGGR